MKFKLRMCLNDCKLHWTVWNITNKIENGNGEYVKETTTRPKSRQTESSMQRENPALRSGPQLAPK